jgi:probable F420-dependent oxidoreductase
MDLPPRFHCRLLDCVFRELTVLEHAGRQSVGRFEQRSQQRGERRFITTLRVPNLVRVGGVLHAVVLYTLHRRPFVTITAMRPFRFATGVRSTATRAEFVDAVREVERLGYSTVMLSDHLVDQFAPISALSVAAAVTSTVRLGTFVFNNDLRHPVVLAQELATLDRLSDGRLEIGMGAGWNKPEYEGAGISFDPGATRIDRMAESITIMKGLFAEGPIDFEGRFYRVKGFEELPRPIQRPHPPFFVGGGSPKLLRFAAENAEIVGIAPRVLPDGKPDVVGCLLAGSERKIAIIKEAAGPRFEELEINTYPSLSALSAKVTDQARPVAREIADHIRRRYGIDLSERDILESPHVFVGSVDGLVEKFQSLRERLGISHIVVGDDFGEFAPVVERLSGK